MKDQDKGSGLPGSKMLKANEGQGKSDAMKSPPRRENRGKTDKFSPPRPLLRTPAKKHGRRKKEKAMKEAPTPPISNRPKPNAAKGDREGR